MLRQFEIQVIPHGIDTETFRPVDKGSARIALGIPPDRSVVMFGSAFAGDRRKGPDLFMRAIGTAQAGSPKPIHVALMGSWGSSLVPDIESAGCEVTNFDYIDSDRLKAVLYSAADLFVFPSRADNAPLTVLESQACGTPVTAFDVGGVGELVRHGETGVLVPAEDAMAMGRVIAELLGRVDERQRLGEEARRRAVADYTIEETVRRHLDLYRTLARPSAG
jgi:glycosyltransferase involved in cell wall biosynthesis